MDNLPDGHPHGDLDQTTTVYLAGQSEGLGATAFSGAIAGEFLGAIADDPGNGRQSLDVVDQRRLTPKTGLCRERRSESWHASSSLNGRHQRGFLTADKGSCTFNHPEF